jgi:hypothetical protein
VYLALAGLAVVISVLKAPAFPINDPAMFEYFGRSLLHGGHLYTGDLIDNKLPSIYVVNEILQALFGANYFLHTCAEAVVNLGSITLFAVMLRKAGVAAWALGTFLFSVFFSLPFPQFDYAQHYCVFFIVLALCLDSYGRYALAGAAVALATTFWPPAALTCIPILMQRFSERWFPVLGGFLAVAALSVIGLRLVSGRQIFTDVIAAWTQYVQLSGIDPLRLRDTFLWSGLGPGILAMGALLLLVIRRPTSPVSRFALVWSACAFAGFVIPPRFAEHYLLPSTPALAMAIASYGLSLKDVVRRPIIALVALALLSTMALNIVRIARAFDSYALYVQRIGHWIRSSIGDGALVYTFEFVPEVQLASDAVRPTRDDPSAWTEVPEVVVFGPSAAPDLARKHYNVTAQGDAKTVVYVPVCPGLTGRLFIYAVSSKVHAFPCRLQLK